jgi:hypothetical protein
MRKLMTVAVAGLALVASQAAANSNGVLSAVDRVGSTSATSNALEGEGAPLLLLLTAAAGIVVVIALAEGQDDDAPASP